ncbi:MAG: lysostaphin resistance A-like protein [Dehalococcoidia bacterium]
MDAPQRPPHLEALPTPVRWSGRDLAGALGLLLLGYAVVLSIVAAIALNFGDPEVESGPALAIALATLGFSIWLGAIVVLLARRKRLTLEQLGFTPLPGLAKLWPLATWGSGLVIVFVYGAAILLIEEATGRDLSRLAEGNPLPEGAGMTDAVWIVLGLSVVVVAPLSEELFFRGLVFRAVQARWGLVLGMVISGLLFSLVHFEISVVAPFWGIGMLFAFAYHRSGSLWTPVIAHAIFNGVSFAVTISGVSP